MVEWVKKKGMTENIWGTSRLTTSDDIKYMLFVDSIVYEDDKYIMIDCRDGVDYQDMTNIYTIVLLKSEKLKKEKPLEK